MPSEARQKKIMEKLNRAQKCSILGPQNLGWGGPGPRGPPWIRTWVTLLTMETRGGSKLGGGRERGATAQNFLNFMHFLGKSGKFVCWRPLLQGSLDSPLQPISDTQIFDVFSIILYVTKYERTLSMINKSLNMQKACCFLLTEKRY